MHVGFGSLQVAGQSERQPLTLPTEQEQRCKGTQLFDLLSSTVPDGHTQSSLHTSGSKQVGFGLSQVAGQREWHPFTLPLEH